MSKKSIGLIHDPEHRDSVTTTAHLGAGEHPPSFMVWERLNVHPVSAGRGADAADAVAAIEQYNVRQIFHCHPENYITHSSLPHRHFPTTHSPEAHRHKTRISVSDWKYQPAHLHHLNAPPPPMRVGHYWALGLSQSLGGESQQPTNPQPPLAWFSTLLMTAISSPLKTLPDPPPPIFFPARHLLLAYSPPLACALVCLFQHLMLAGSPSYAAFGH